jgi:hypothetical protein
LHNWVLPEACEITVPAELPFLASLSWSDRGWRALGPLEMLRRYESGWRNEGVLAEPSVEEQVFIRALVQRFGSIVDA